MDICHIYKYEKQAIESAKEYSKEHYEEITKVMIQQLNSRIWTKDGNIHYFMGENRYFQWSKGRTYMLSDGTMMHSGYPIKV